MKATAKNQGNIKRMLQVLAMSMLIVAFTGCKGTTDSGPKDDIAFKDNTTITCYGTIVYLENPCITIPCIPGIIYGINTGNDFAIISYKNKVFSSDTPLNINNMFFFKNDSVKIIGSKFEKKDINQNAYLEIQIDSIIPIAK